MLHLSLMVIVLGIDNRSICPGHEVGVIGGYVRIARYLVYLGRDIL